MSLFAKFSVRGAVEQKFWLELPVTTAAEAIAAAAGIVQGFDLAERDVQLEFSDIRLSKHPSELLLDLASAKQFLNS